MDLGLGEVGAASVAFLGMAAFLAGLVDAIAGGGGLIQIPVLFAMFPSSAPAILLGTNKFSAVFGTSFAAVRYARTTHLEWNAALPAAVTALGSAFLGAWLVTRVPPDGLRTALPFVLTGIALYTYFKDKLGVEHSPMHRGLRESVLGIALGAVIGFYDGFFGPGTGSFLLFLFVRLFGFDFLSASAAAKIVNVACNLAALAWFVSSGNVAIPCAVLMAACNLFGAAIGTRLALTRGSRFVRQMFLGVVALLVIKIVYDNSMR
jgi:uncharacterized membrane protein YfcA